MTEYERSSAQVLYNEYYKTFRNYKKYGDVVLDVDLKKEPGIRKVFLNSKNEREYEENIKAYWCQENQVIISKCSDIDEFHAEYPGNNEEIPVVTDVPKSDMSKYKHLISEEFYNRLVKNAKSNSSVYVETQDFIYVVHIFDAKNGRRHIGIESKKIIKKFIVKD